MNKHPHIDDLKVQNLDLTFEDWGLIEYETAEKKQLETLESVFENQSLGVVVFCQHPPLVSLGKQTEESDICGWTGALFQSGRGGRATYHGPSQVVIYPIINLKHPIAVNNKWEVVSFIRKLEELVIKVLNEYKVEGSQHPRVEPQKINLTSTSSRAQLDTGVWVDNQKIASIGLSVKKWITYHGIAVNLDNDPLAFKGINPCGYSSKVMTNLEHLTRAKIDHNQFKMTFKQVFINSTG